MCNIYTTVLRRNVDNITLVGGGGEADGIKWRRMRRGHEEEAFIILINSP